MVYKDKAVRNRLDKINRETRRALAIEFLGGKCVVCGSTENLDFDHIDPSTKLFNISQGLRLPEIRFWNEVRKCQLLCRPHHELKSISEGSKSRKGMNHPSSKLRDLDIKYIRYLYSIGHSSRNIAKEFEITAPTVLDIVNHKMWTHID